MDQQIIAAQRKQEYEAHQDIFAGEVWIGAEKYVFSPREFFDGRLSVWIPESFKFLPKELAKLKYPMEQRPPVILTNEDTTVNIALSLFDAPFSAEMVEQATNTYKAMMHQMNPSYAFIDTKFLPMEKNRLGYYDFLSRGFDASLYQLFAFTCIDKKMLHFIFNAPAKVMNDWKGLALQILQSIRDIRGTQTSHGRQNPGPAPEPAGQ